MVAETIGTEYGVERPALGFQYAEATRHQAPYEPRGAALKFLYCKDPAILLDGPAGTGKTRALLEKALAVLELYPGVRCLLLRKTRASLTQTALVTWETKVLPYKWQEFIPFHTTDQEYQHPNGSVLAVAGLDNPAKIMSSEWDIIFIPEATELKQEEFEYLTTRLRNFGGGIGYQQICMDCNPQGPKHWLNLLCETPADKKDPAGPKMITRIKSKHKDNPEYWDNKLLTWTARGRLYLKALKKLSGVRFYRLYKGMWRQAEGLVYPEWDDNLHRVFMREVPATWARFWGVDFGYNSPFVWQEWARDGEGRLWLINEIYMTGRLVSDHCKDILKITNNIKIRPRAVICDHDAEGRATLERELGITTVPAYKASKLENIEAVRRRLRKWGDGVPGLQFMRDSLYQIDYALKDKHMPLQTIDEPEGYVWADNAKKESDGKKEVPIDENDHGMDAMSYVVAHVDKIDKENAGRTRKTDRFKG